MSVLANERTINPGLERWYAAQANSHKFEVSGASHPVYVSVPTEVAVAYKPITSINSASGSGYAICLWLYGFRHSRRAEAEWTSFGRQC